MLNKAVEREEIIVLHILLLLHILHTHFFFFNQIVFFSQSLVHSFVKPPNIDLLLSYCLRWVFESWQRKRQKRSSKSGSKFLQIKAQKQNQAKKPCHLLLKVSKMNKRKNKKRCRVQSGEAELQVGIKSAEPQSTRCLTSQKIDKQKSPHYFFVIKNVPLLLANTVISHCLVTVLGFKGRKIIITDQNAQACIYKQQLLFPGARGGRTNKCEKRDDILGHIPTLFRNGWGRLGGVCWGGFLFHRVLWTICFSRIAFL